METFSKFLENGGTLPEEPPVVSEVPLPWARGFHPPQDGSKPQLGGGWTLLCPTAGWGRGVWPSFSYHHLLQVTKTPENSTGTEELSPSGTAEARDEL